MPYDPTTANCYPNSAVLINKLGIRDDRTLMQAESYYSAMRLMELENGIKFENVDFDFYLSIHKYLFQDIYDWAGQIRTTNISKKWTCFCPYEFIRETGEAIFHKLKHNNYYKDVSERELPSCIAELFDSLNILHPFREGNGRTEKAFISALLKNIGYSIDFYNCDKDYLTIATIFAAQGVMDRLVDFFAENIELIGKIDR